MTNAKDARDDEYAIENGLPSLSLDNWDYGGGTAEISTKALEAADAVFEMAGVDPFTSDQDGEVWVAAQKAVDEVYGVATPTEATPKLFVFYS